MRLEVPPTSCFYDLMKKIFSVIFLTVLIIGLGCPNPGVEQYLRDLKSPNVVIKMEAIYRVGELRIKEAVPDLISLLNEDSGQINAEIIEALGKIGDSAAVEPLIAKLNENNPLILEKTIEALGKIGDKRAVPALASILEQKDSRSEGEVLTGIWALGNIGNRFAEPILISLLNKDDKYIRYNVEQALKRIPTAEPHPHQKGKMPQAKGTVQPLKDSKKNLKKAPAAQPKLVQAPLPPKKEAPQVKKSYQSSKPPVFQKAQKFVKKKVSQPPEKKTRARKSKSEPRPQLPLRKKDDNAKGEDKSSPKMKAPKSPPEPGKDKMPQPKRAALPPTSKAKAKAAVPKPTERKQAAPEPHLFTFDASDKPRDRSTLIARAWLADEMGPYTVHVDFKKYDESAKEVAGKLKKLGYQVYIRKMDVAGRGVLYRVFIGGFKDEPAAEKTAKKLRREYGLFFVRVLPTAYVNW